MINIHTNNTITRTNQAIPFARITNEQHNKTTVNIYGKGELVFEGRSHIPARPGTVSEWKINPAFAEFVCK